MRRVVTGHTPDEKSIFASDTEVDAITSPVLSGWEFYRLWGADKAPTFPDDGLPSPYSTHFPPVGGFRFGTFTIPPESVERTENLDFSVMLEAIDKVLPGAAKYMEKDNPGMHATDTIDFEYIISGEIWLELDDCKEIHLRAGDTVIQNGTRHAWHNKGSEPCSMVLCLIGAHRK
jgi:mannose-6-phosphate isomerase-like protein (cupin superfamily)